jgi:hypothetical protein
MSKDNRQKGALNGNELFPKKAIVPEYKQWNPDNDFSSNSPTFAP